MRQDDRILDPRPTILPRRWPVIAVALALLVAGGVATSCWLRADRRFDPDGPPQPSSGGAPDGAALLDAQFRDWPAGKKPDVALVLTGQQHSYLKFCGCSRPQLGGLERRYNLFAALRQRGWPIVAADLGDIVAYTDGVHDQSLLKYETALKALQVLGYSAIGVGELDLRLPLIEGLGRTILQDPAAYPPLLSANLANRVTEFPHPSLEKQSMIREVAAAGGQDGQPRIGIVSVTGTSVQQRLKEGTPARFDPQDTVLKALAQRMDRADPKLDVRLLLYQGDFADALKIAKAMPNAFDVILSLCAEQDPPSRPDMIGKTMVIRVGHRGRHIGIVGAFRTGNADQPIKLHYQLVSLGEEFETPKGQEANHPIVKLLESYAAEVKLQNFLGKYPQNVHAVQAAFPQQKAHFVGSEACKECHKRDYDLWKESKHSHALDALSKIADKPANRQFDPDCVRCHTVGFGVVSGYVDEKKTPNLMHVGCETCHGPGSMHVKDPKNARYFPGLSPWKVNANDLLAKPTDIAKGFEALTQNEQKVFNRVNDLCIKCHDIDNDPHYKLHQYWPKIVHGKNAPPPNGVANVGKSGGNGHD